MNRSALILGVLVVALAVIAGLIFYARNRTDENTATDQEQGQTPIGGNQDTGSDVAGSGELTPGAQTYTSDRLGVSFTYNPNPAENFQVKVTETGNRIYVHGGNERPTQGKMIEVFDKPADATLTGAITQRLLRGYSPALCFAQEVPRDQDDPRPDTYSFAEISYPAPSDPEAPFFQNASRCPQPYAKTNAVQYFLANSEVPTKFLFLQLGQDSITDDGTTRTVNGSRQDWSASVRIVK